MQRRWHLWAEAGIVVLGLFFFLRELGTFPETWIDDSLFLIVARNLAEGRGYTLPILGEFWSYPYMLAVGPTVITPAALGITFFGFSVAAARLPMVLYLIATSAVFYFFTRRIAGRTNAALALLLLVTLSAFVNAGKPVLGEVPGLFFLISGLLLWQRTRGKDLKGSFGSGVLLGLGAVTKLTYGIVFIALGMAFLAALAFRRWKDARVCFVVGTASAATFLAFTPMLGLSDPGFLWELWQYAFAEGGSTFARLLLQNPGHLFKLPFLAFGVMVILGGYGLWLHRRDVVQDVWIVLIALITLFVLYFLNGLGWYRHLMPAHALLLPFVPSGIHAIFGRTGARTLLLCLAVAQGLWQFDHRGSPYKNTSMELAVRALEERYADIPLIIQQPEIFIRVHSHPRWKFMTTEFEAQNYPRFKHLPLLTEQHCLPVVRRLTGEQQQAFGERVDILSGSFTVIRPPESCRKEREVRER